jgi:glycosyltransferase involved in cell wall biosynthesis
MRAEIRAGREPRLDVFAIAERLGADVIDFIDVDRSQAPAVRLAARALGASAATALLGYRERERYDAILTTGEDIGIPLAAMLSTSSAKCSHTMIAHTLFPLKKRVFFQYLRVQKRIDNLLVYSTSEEQNTTRLGIPPSKVRRIYYHADQLFFRPDERTPEPDLVCAAGQLLRDYDCLVEAARGMPFRVEIAAGSPWIDEPLVPRAALPPNVSWGKRDRFALRDLYGRASVAVVPILQNDYQTGIATILEMMASGKCVIATKTRGQTDTIVDGVTGIYVPPSDPAALRAAIRRCLDAPDETARIGRAARQFVTERAGLDLFVENIAEAVQAGHAIRSST